MMDEIDEIPERDIPPSRDAHRLSLRHLAVILTFIFITLAVMLVCSKGFDYIASKIWPSTNTSTKPEIITKAGTTRIELPANNKLPTNQANTTNTTNPTNVQPNQYGYPKSTASNTAVEPIPPFPEKLSSNPTPSVSETTADCVEKVEEPKINLTNHANLSPQLDAPEKNANQPLKLSTAEKAILKANANHYTIQILAMHNKKKIQPFLDNNPLKGKVKCCQGEFKGKPWYMLIYGDYSTKEEAQKAILTLPAEVQKEKPWVRKIAAVQETIHARK